MIHPAERQICPSFRFELQEFLSRSAPGEASIPDKRLIKFELLKQRLHITLVYTPLLPMFNLDSHLDDVTVDIAGVYV